MSVLHSLTLRYPFARFTFGETNFAYSLKVHAEVLITPQPFEKYLHVITDSSRTVSRQIVMHFIVSDKPLEDWQLQSLYCCLLLFIAIPGEEPPVTHWISVLTRFRTQKSRTQGRCRLLLLGWGCSARSLVTVLTELTLSCVFS
jgi:hypothetical protein